MSELPGASFAEKMAAFQKKMERERHDIFVGVVADVSDSVRFGSTVTTAPGQPVDTRNLRDSWQTTFEGPETALVATHEVYARAVEDGQQEPYVRRSEHGYDYTVTPKAMHFQNHGPHSVKLTRAGFDRLVEAVIKRVKGSTILDAKVSGA